MRIAFEYFHWPCLAGGYEWQDAEPLRDEHGQPDVPDRRFLMPCDVAGRMTLTHPLVSHPTLFKTFAALDPTEASFAAFAAQYGLLGVDYFLNRRGPLEKAIGEPFSRWHEEWKRVGAVVHLLDAVQALDARVLQRCIVLREDSAGLNLQMSDGVTFLAQRIASREAVRPWLWQFALGASNPIERLARLASGWLHATINDSIDASRSDGAVVPARILFEPDKARFALHLVPQTLLAALWFQCARALTEHPEFKQCEHVGCGKWFELSPDARRRRSKYCSDRCKVAAYRMRKLLEETRNKEQTRTKSRAKNTRPRRNDGKTHTRSAGAR